MLYKFFLIAPCNAFTIEFRLSHVCQVCLCEYASDDRSVFYWPAFMNTLHLSNAWRSVHVVPSAMADAGLSSSLVLACSCSSR